jgi:transcriptional regulator with XRE-family HTH domain
MESKSSQLSRYLRSLRQANALTLRAVEEKAGVSNAYLSQLESGKVKHPSPVVLHRLATLYDVPYETLMEKAGYPVPRDCTSPSEATRSVFGRLTEDEQEALLDYLSFLRTRGRIRRGKS